MQVAGVIRECTAESGQAMAARVGGDEFCILLPSGTLGDAERLALGSIATSAQRAGPESA